LFVIQLAESSSSRGDHTLPSARGRARRHARSRDQQDATDNSLVSLLFIVVLGHDVTVVESEQFASSVNYFVFVGNITKQIGVHLNEAGCALFVLMTFQ